MKNKIFAIVAVLVIGGGVAAFFYYKNSVTKTESPQTADTQATESTQPTGTKSIIVLTTDNSVLSTLASAVKAANLSELLDGVGPYTVLAPSNDAFKALPAGTLDTLLKLENAEKLKNILSYHVIPGTVRVSQLTNGQKIKTVNSQELVVDTSDGKVAFIDAKGGKAVVTKKDINAKNGVVHIVNAVLLPQ